MIYAVAVSLGIVRVPLNVASMEAVLLDIPETQEVKSPEITPELAEPQLAMAEVQIAQPVEIESVIPDVNTETPAPLAITASPSVPESANLAVRTRVEPGYPPASRRLGEQGAVMLRVLVDERGRPADIIVATSSGYPGLDDAAVEAVRRWRFAAAKRDGAAISSWTRVRILFRLD